MRWIWKLSVILGIRKSIKFFLRKEQFGRNLNFQKISFYSKKCKKAVLLSGRYFISQGSNKCIIVVQGFGRHLRRPGAGVFEITESLLDAGFNVLIFDLRAHGESGGRRVSLGYYEISDVLEARDFVVNQKKIQPQNIGLMGFSFGAMISILAASKDGFGSLAVDSAPADIFGSFPQYFLRMAKSTINFFFGVNVEELNVRKAAKRISAPIFIIYGRKDRYLFTSAKELLFLKKSHPLDREWPTDASHCTSYLFSPEQYIQKIVEFFNQALKPTFNE